MNLFKQANIVLHSGEESDFKIECEALPLNDIRTLAYLISKKYKFGGVMGIPKGGELLALALEPYLEEGNLNILIVDDVLTTGASMEEAKALLPKGLNVQGVVIFARGKCPNWVKPIFQMWDLTQGT